MFQRNAMCPTSWSKCKPSKNISKKQTAGRANKQTPFVTCLLLALLFKLEDWHHFFEMSVDLYWTTWCWIPADCTLHSHYCVNLKPNISCEFFGGGTASIFGVKMCRVVTQKTGILIYQYDTHLVSAHVFSFKTFKSEWRHFLRSNLTENGE